ncbi:MAG: DUF2804 domain-containing protein [Treponema sp.]|nr:DUF2804 domain-containing protein [Treponema sp.]
MTQTEITEPVSILGETGRPQNFGWARSPVFTYNPSLLNAARRKKSESDRYILFSPTHAVLLEIFDDGYLGYLCISVIYLKDRKKSFVKTLVTPFSLGAFDLPYDSNSGSVKFKQKKALVNFACMEEGVRLIKVDIPNFGPRHESIVGQVVLTPLEGAESLVTHMSWRENAEAFSCSRRSPGYFAEGVIQFGISEFVFTRGDGWGIFDWCRGVRPRSDLRFWAAASGQTGDHHAGFSVGHCLADSSLGTENAFFLDGKIHKLNQISFPASLDRYKPSRFTSSDNRLEMTFTPLYEQEENHQMFFYSLKRRQLFGSFSGKAILDDGLKFVFNDLKGMLERRKSRF